MSTAPAVEPVSASKSTRIADSFTPIAATPSAVRRPSHSNGRGATERPRLTCTCVSPGLQAIELPKNLRPLEDRSCWDCEIHSAPAGVPSRPPSARNGLAGAVLPPPSHAGRHSFRRRPLGTGGPACDFLWRVGVGRAGSNPKCLRRPVAYAATNFAPAAALNARGPDSRVAARRAQARRPGLPGTASGRTPALGRWARPAAAAEWSGSVAWRRWTRTA